MTTNNIRHKLLALLAQSSATIVDLEQQTGMSRKKLYDNLRAAVESSLISRAKDDVTGLPLYVITAAGKKRLAEGPQSVPKISKTPKTEVMTQAGSGGNNSGIHEAASLVEQEHPSTAVMDVIEPETQDETPADPCSDDKESIARLTELVRIHSARADAADSMVDDYRQALLQKEGEYTYALQMIRNALSLDDQSEGGIVPAINALSAENTALKARIAALESNLDLQSDSMGKTVIDFCEWLANKAEVRCPLNLHECKAVVQDIINGLEVMDDLESEIKQLRQQPPVVESKLGYTVIEFADDELEKNVFGLDQARDKAAIHTLRTGKKTAVFAILDRVENVAVQWAA